MSIRTINNYLLVKEHFEEETDQQKLDPIFQLKKKGHSMKEFVTCEIVAPTDNDKDLYLGDLVLAESHMLRKYDDKTFILPINAVIGVIKK
jgi:hypothetical protein